MQRKNKFHDGGRLSASAAALQYRFQRPRLSNGTGSRAEDGLRSRHVRLRSNHVHPLQVDVPGQGAADTERLFTPVPELRSDHIF